MQFRKPFFGCKLFLLVLTLILILPLSSFAKKKHRAVKHYNIAVHAPVRAQDYVASPALDAAINAIIFKNDPNADIGIDIRSGATGAILYQKNANHLFKPASSLKIFTAAAALLRFGPDYTMQTKVLIRPNVVIKDGIIFGDVYFYFDGDPLLQRQHLTALVADLKARGINEIRGNVYIDDTIFDQENYGPGWMWDEQNFCYAAPTNAIMLDKNCFPFSITPGRQENRPAHVASTVGHEFMYVTSNLISKRVSYDDCPMEMRVSEDNKYYLSGCVWPSSSTISLLVAVKNIRLYAMHVLSDTLVSQRIAVHGAVRFSRSPITQNFDAVANKDYIVLASHNSLPLSELVKIMLKKSDNLIADALFKKVGYSYYHKPATWHNSAEAVIAVLAQNSKINFSNTRIVDGSGLSHYNLVSPATMVALLNYIYHNPVISAPFIAALPSSGVDGSLAYRMGTEGLRDKIHAKTGTMTGITALAGYITTANGNILDFVIIINDFIGKVYRYRAMEDEICALLVRGRA